MIKEKPHRNAWIAIRASTNDFKTEVDASFAVVNHIKIGDFVAVYETTQGVISFGRAYRIRAIDNRSIIYFDQIQKLVGPISAQEIGVLNTDMDAEDAPKLLRVAWEVFEKGMQAATGFSPWEMTTLKGDTQKEKAYFRELLQVATIDELLGPAGGPEEEIISMNVSDRYLVGKLAPQDLDKSAVPKALEMEDYDIDSQDLIPLVEKTSTILTDDGKKKKIARSRVVGEEFTNSPMEPDAEVDEDTSAAKNQSFMPSAIGLTVCVDGQIDELEIEVRWGHYQRLKDHDYTRPTKDGGLVKEKAWRRKPAGGVLRLPLVDGKIAPLSPDSNTPEVIIKGVVRPPLGSGDRLVTLFLVNTQPLASSNRDETWLFQPEIILRHKEGKPAFRKRPLPPRITGGVDTEEEDALELVYRRRIEFGVGHSISVHATPSIENIERAVEVRTTFIPEHEVPITETPGFDPADRKALKLMVNNGYLDMKRLATMERSELTGVLEILSDDYESWIHSLSLRVGKDIVGHDKAAKSALEKCEVVRQRLLEGIDVLRKDDLALKAFRFANAAMAAQRLRSIYSLRKRRGEKIKFEDVDLAKNRSWRPFQLAFMLLSIPAIADPLHPDRTNATGLADLIWFPTGGGKTEAYLGVAAFTMGMRRLDPTLGDLDGSRGLSVIMRYTLRLLTLQQFQRATTLICAMEVIRRKDDTFGNTPFSIGLWVGSKLTPNTTEDSHASIESVRQGRYPTESSPAQLTNCPWCGNEILPGRDIDVRRVASEDGRTVIYCGDAKSRCDFSRGKSKEGLPIVVVDEEMYRRPPTMLIATVDKFAMMAWRGEVRNLFGQVKAECLRHGFLTGYPTCKGTHKASKKGYPAVSQKKVGRLRPPDLIIQDEFHLISGPLGTMVGLYETAVDELCSWEHKGKKVHVKIIASTATVRKAKEQINNVFLREVSIFPPHGLDIEDNFFSVQRSIAEKPGRKYMGICAPGSSRPAILIKLYSALLTSSQEIFTHFGNAADPWMTLVGYFNSLRELGGTRRLAEDDIQTRCYRIENVFRPGLKQRSIQIVNELTSRIQGKDIPRILDQLEVRFKAKLSVETGKWSAYRNRDDAWPLDIVLATNMLSVGVDINRIGLMVVNSQPKNTAEYIQATSRVGRAFPGLVCTVLTWSKPRDLSHYESFEHYHNTFYKHVEAQSVTPFSPRALDRGLTGTMISCVRLSNDKYNPNLGAQEVVAGSPEVEIVKKLASKRGHNVTDLEEIRKRIRDMIDERCDEWKKAARQGGRRLGYKRGQVKKKGDGDIAGLLKKPGIDPWGIFTTPQSLREVEPGVRLILSDVRLDVEKGPIWDFSETKFEIPDGFDPDDFEEEWVDIMTYLSETLGFHIEGSQDVENEKGRVIGMTIAKISKNSKILYLISEEETNASQVVKTLRKEGAEVLRAQSWDEESIVPRVLEVLGEKP